MVIVALLVPAEVVSNFPVCKLREKFGKNEPETCTRMRCPFLKTLLVIEIVEVQFVRLIGIKQLTPFANVAIAGAQNVQTRVHQVECRAVRSDVESRTQRSRSRQSQDTYITAWIGPVTSVSCSRSVESNVRTSLRWASSR